MALDPNLLAELLAEGLPFVSGQDEPTRPLTTKERNLLLALKIKYLPDGERDLAYSRRPDLKNLRSGADQRASERPFIAAMRAAYLGDIENLDKIINQSQSAEAVILARIVKRQYRLMARMVRADMD